MLTLSLVLPQIVNRVLSIGHEVRTKIKSRSTNTLETHYNTDFDYKIHIEISVITEKCYSISPRDNPYAIRKVNENNFDNNVDNIVDNTVENNVDDNFDNSVDNNVDNLIDNNVDNNVDNLIDNNVDNNVDNLVDKYVHNDVHNN